MEKSPGYGGRPRARLSEAGRAIGITGRGKKCENHPFFTLPLETLFRIWNQNRSTDKTLKKWKIGQNVCCVFYCPRQGQQGAGAHIANRNVWPFRGGRRIYWNTTRFPIKNPFPFNVDRLGKREDAKAIFLLHTLQNVSPVAILYPGKSHPFVLVCCVSRWLCQCKQSTLAPRPSPSPPEATSSSVFDQKRFKFHQNLLLKKLISVLLKKYTKIEQQFNDDFFPFLYFSRYEQWRFPPSNPFASNTYIHGGGKLCLNALSPSLPPAAAILRRKRNLPQTRKSDASPPKKIGPLHTQSALASNNAFPPISGTQQHTISPHIYPQARAEITILFYGPACCYVCALRQDILFEMHRAGIVFYSCTILTAVSPREIFWIQCLKQIGSDSARVATKRTFFYFCGRRKKNRTWNRKKTTYRKRKEQNLQTRRKAFFSCGYKVTLKRA